MPKHICPACQKEVDWWRASVDTDVGRFHHRCYHLTVARNLPPIDRKKHIAWLNGGGGLRPGYK